MKIFFTFLLLFIGNTAHTQGFGTIHGRVTDQETNELLPSVIVRLLSCDTGKMLEARITDEEGFYSFSAVSPGSYQLQFDFIGYETVVLQDIAVRQGQQTNLQTVMKECSLVFETF